MYRTIRCSCGYEMQGADDEELYSLVRQHIAQLHPERHKPVPRPVAAVSPRRSAAGLKSQKLAFR